jgi:LysR family transcriptional regulator, hydrogen peroxide-inducible genes activator
VASNVKASVPKAPLTWATSKSGRFDLGDCQPVADDNGLAVVISKLHPEAAFVRALMDLHEIRYFLALSKTLNFTKAAELCGITQPALTRAIRKMEEELGGLLFSRERNNTHQTDLGRLIEPHLAEVVAQAGQAKQTAARFLKLEEAHLALGVMCTIAPVQFVGFLGRFRSDNPGVEVTVLEGVPEQLCKYLIEGKLDVAIMARPDGFQSPLRALELYPERFVVACAAGHRFAAKSDVPMAELDGEFLLSRINCEYVDVLDRLCREQKVNLIRSHRSEREDWILNMVAAGLGICFLPEYTAVFPGVVGCTVVLPSVARTVCLVTVAGRRASSPVKAFVQTVRRYAWPSPAARAVSDDRVPERA